MKIAVHIFTIYMLALSLIPCSDGGGGIVETANHFLGIEHQHVSDHEQHTNGCSDDTCSPFCVCSCCSMALEIPVTPSLKIKHPAPTPTKSPSFIPTVSVSPFYNSIWHPPAFS